MPSTTYKMHRVTCSHIQPTTPVSAPPTSNPFTYTRPNCVSKVTGSYPKVYARGARTEPPTPTSWSKYYLTGQVCPPFTRSPVADPPSTPASSWPIFQSWPFTILKVASNAAQAQKVHIPRSRRLQADSSRAIFRRSSTSSSHLTAR
jgi:hypothetical protein